ncbi:glycoside hydrolase family protein [Tessaracoccus coleopterorum]|uniref:hypothetical protein n=1 Tax=Tessaracoccus coleopterorum TaxID=2714950 RepID=UPI0038CD8652
MAYDWKKGGSDCTPSNYQACIGYATASSPLGPWTYQGIILGGTSATTVHPSIIEFGGTWYITYHTKDAVNGGHFRRSVAIDEIGWDGDKLLPVTPTLANDPLKTPMANVARNAHLSATYTETPRCGSAHSTTAAPPRRCCRPTSGATTAAPPVRWSRIR